VGKTKRSDKEFTEKQRLVQENRVLKRQVAALRKELARIDLNRYGDLKETIEKHYQDDRHQEGQDILERLKQEWKCNQPECLGYLEIFVYNKLETPWYFRKCSNLNCGHRTKSQIYTSNVKGILKK